MTDPMLLTSAALTSYNHACNIIKALFELKQDTVIVGQLNALTREIQTLYGINLDLHQKITACLAEKDEIGKELHRFEQWEDQKRRYKLYSPWESAVIYALTEADSRGEPPHWICANCYENRKRSFLYPRHVAGHEEFFCHCGTVVPSPHRGSYKIEYVKTIP